MLDRMRNNPDEGESEAERPPGPDDRMDRETVDPREDLFLKLEGMLSKLVDSKLATVLDKMNTLFEENQKLREDLLNQNNLNYAAGIPNHLKQDTQDVDPGRMQVARSVTVATRAANPDIDKHVVNPGGLVRNSLSRSEE